MSSCTMAVMWLLFLSLVLKNGQASVIVGCPIHRYMSNGTCHECPDNCRVCVSDTNCTLCQKGFYGPVCENRCGEGCTGTCHKLFGHCTHGCPDGQYPAESNGCRLCPLNCSLCESQSKCVLCEAGHFGEDCQERCPEYCTACNKTTGQCFQCKDSYVRVNEQCKSCPQGCRSCVSINTCDQCKDSYFKHDMLCNSCPYGCRFCNTTDNCQSCENGFHGPVGGRCLYKCPSNGKMTYNVQYEDGRCGIWQDTDTNICHLQSESQSCSSSGNCIQAIGCPYSVRCMDEHYEQISCVNVMQYECKHKCKQLLSSYGCEANCTVHASTRNTRSNLLCMNDTNFIDLHTFANTAKADCSQEQVASFETTEPSLTTGTIVHVVFTTLLTIIIVILVILLIRSRRLVKQKQSNVKDEHFDEITDLDNRTHAKRDYTTTSYTLFFYCSEMIRKSRLAKPKQSHDKEPYWNETTGPDDGPQATRDYTTSEYAEAMV